MKTLFQLLLSTAALAENVCLSVLSRVLASADCSRCATQYVKPEVCA